MHLHCEVLTKTGLDYQPWLHKANLHGKVLDMCKAALDPDDAVNFGNSAPYASQLQIRHRKRDGGDIVVPSDDALVRAAEHEDALVQDFELPEHCSNLSHRVWQRIEVVLLAWQLDAMTTS